MGKSADPGDHLGCLSDALEHRGGELQELAEELEKAAEDLEA